MLPDWVTEPLIAPISTIKAIDGIPPIPRIESINSIFFNIFLID